MKAIITTATLAILLSSCATVSLTHTNQISNDAPTTQKVEVSNDNQASEADDSSSSLPQQKYKFARV